MKINKLEIVNFGKLSDFTVELDSEFQIIFGNNEDGKTTIMSFILLMFYSDHGRRSSLLEQMPRQLYLPWNGSPMEGAMEFTDKQVRYRLQKLFGDTPSKDKVNLINLDTGSPVALARKTEVGKHFFGLDLAGFKRSSYIGQIGSIEAGKDTDDVAEKLLTNLVSGDDELSQQDVLTRLSSAKFALVSKNGTKGILAETKAALETLKEERTQVRFQLEGQEELQHQYEEMKAKLDEQNRLAQQIKSVRQLTEKSKLKQLLFIENQVERLETNLVNENYNVEALDSFFEQSKDILERYERKAELIKSFEDIDDDSVYISTPEREKLDELVGTKAQISRLVLHYEHSVVPAKLKVELITQDHAKLVNEKNKLESNLLEIKPKKERLLALEAEKAALLSQLDRTESTLDEKENAANRERELQGRELESYRIQMANLEKSSSPNWLLIIVGAFLLITGIVLGFLINPTVYSACALGLLLVMIGFIKKGKKESPQSLVIKDSLETARAKLEVWEQEHLRQLTDLKADLKVSTNQLANVNVELAVLTDNFSFDHYHNLENQLTNVTDQLARLALERASANENAQSLSTQLATETKSLGIEETEDNGISLAAALKRIEKTIDHLLKEKHTETIEEFNRKFVRSQAKEKSMATVAQLEAEIKQIKDTFVALISTHSKAHDFDLAIDTYRDLLKQYHQLVELKKELGFTANAIGIDDYSANSLNTMLEKLEDIPQGLSAENLPTLEHQLEILKHSNILGKMEELQQLIRPPARNLEQIALEQAELQDQISEAQLYYDGLSLAFDVMEQANEEMRQSFGPMLNEKTSEIFASLTKDKYNDLLVNKNYAIQFKTSGHFRPWQYLSNGTIDQAYLALRLAISGLIAEEDGTMPVFLDDVLVQYDDDRAKRALEFLSDYSGCNKYQFIMFSCHGRIADFAEELGIKLVKL